MSRLPLRSIEAFVVVARAGTLVQAATRLNITVPAVSRRIQILEHYLDRKLFLRLPRGLGLTEAGEKYLEELGPAWDALCAATLATKAGPLSDRFKVSVIPTFAANWLLPRLTQSAPPLKGVQLDLETEPQVVNLAERRDLGGAIRLGRGPWAGAVGRMFLPIKAYPVASPDFVECHRLERPADLVRHVLIGSSHQPDFWLEWFRLTGLSSSQARFKTFDNLQLVYEAAAGGLGVAIGLDPLLHPYLASGRLRRLWPGDVTLSRGFHLVRSADGGLDKRFTLLGDWLAAQAA